MGARKRIDVQRDVARRVSNELLSSGHLAIVGIPWSGKATVLKQAFGLAKVTPLEIGSRWEPKDLANSICKKLGECKRNSRPEIVVVRQFERVVKLTQKDRDELGRALYDLVQDRPVKLVFVMDRRVREAMNGVECGDSDFTKLFHHEYVKPFNEKELHELLDLEHVNDDGRVAKWLMSRTGGFPKPTVDYLNEARLTGKISIATLVNLADDIGSPARIQEDEWLDRVMRFLERHPCSTCLQQNDSDSVVVNWRELLALGLPRLPYEVNRELKACGLVDGSDKLLGVIASRLKEDSGREICEVESPEIAEDDANGGLGRFPDAVDCPDYPGTDWMHIGRFMIKKDWSRIDIWYDDSVGFVSPYTDLKTARAEKGRGHKSCSNNRNGIRLLSHFLSKYRLSLKKSEVGLEYYESAEMAPEGCSGQTKSLWARYFGSSKGLKRFLHEQMRSTKGQRGNPCWGILPDKEWADGWEKCQRMVHKGGNLS